MHSPLSRGKRGKVAAVLAVAAAALTLAGCSLSPGGSSGSSDAKTLTVGIWKGYGADLPWVATEFKKETGASLKFVYIDSEQNLIDLLAQSNGGIDVALPNIQYIGHGIDKGVLHELDTSKLKNWKDIYPDFSGRDEIRKDDKVYGIPWTYGSTGLFYSDKLFSSAPTSLDVLWDSKYAGTIAIKDDATDTVPTAALYAGQDPQKPDMTTLKPVLQKLKDNSKLLYSSNDELAKAISSGTVQLGIANSDGIGGIIASGASDIKYTIPKQGAVGWIDNWAISAKTKHLSLAYDWLNYMTSPAFLDEWANNPDEAAPAPANGKAVEALSTEAQTRIQAYPDKIGDLALQLPQPADVLQSWQDTWQEVKAG